MSLSRLACLSLLAVPLPILIQQQSPPALSKVTIRSVGSKKGIGVPGTGADLEAVQQYGAKDPKAKTWTFQALTGADQGYYLIHLDGTEACLDVRGGSKDDSAPVIVYRCAGVDNQKWHMTPVTTCTVVLEAKHSGKVLDVPGGSTADGVQLIQYAKNGGTNQQWRICDQ